MDYRMIGTLRTAIKYIFLALVVAVCIYAALNTLTLLLWGDPSVRGVPRTFHPPQIVILHYARLISPLLGKCIELAIFLGIGFLMYVGFRQLTGKNLLDCPVRRDIVQFIRMHPGRHFRSIVRGTGINRGTLYYHLMQLKSLRVITEQKDGGLSRYFVRLNGISPLEQKILIHADNRIRDGIIRVLDGCPAMIREDLRKSIGISGPLLWYHIRILVTDGIVIPQQDGRRTRYSLNPDAAEIMRWGSFGSPDRERSHAPSFARHLTGPDPSDDTKVRV
jgi:predicted transcriptional regulator